MFFTVLECLHLVFRVHFLLRALAAGLTCRIDTIVTSGYIFTALGVPYSWKKFRGGDSVAWIGFEVDFWRYSVGISGARASWLIGWAEKTLEDGCG